MSEISIGKEAILSGTGGKFEPSNPAPNIGQFVEMRTGASNSEYFKPKKIPSLQELQEEEDQVVINFGTTYFKKQLLTSEKFTESLKLKPDGHLDYRKPGSDELTSLFAHLCMNSETLYKSLLAIGNQHPEWKITVNEDREKQLLSYSVINKTAKKK